MAVELLMRAAGGTRAPLALLAASCAACAPGAFDDLRNQAEQGDPSVPCDEDEACTSEPGLDAAFEPELDAEPEPEPEPGPEIVPEPEPEADACTSCSEDAAPQPEVDAEACPSCSEPSDAALCIDDAGAMCGPDAGACGGAAPVCSAGQRQSEQRACGACNTGEQTRMRSCAADGCSWGAWGAWSGCSGVTAPCAPNETTGCTNGDECGQRVCSSSCSWGACVPKVANGCLRIREGHTDQGSNYRCCGGGGHWQFCLPDCRWSSDCVACSQGAPSFCTECY